MAAGFRFTSSHNFTKMPTVFYVFFVGPLSIIIIIGIISFMQMFLRQETVAKENESQA